MSTWLCALCEGLEQRDMHRNMHRDVRKSHRGACYRLLRYCNALRRMGRAPTSLEWTPAMQASSSQARMDIGGGQGVFTVTS